MLFFIQHEGKEHRVRVESRQNQVYVTFDDCPEEAVDLVFYGNDCMFIHQTKVFHANIVGDKVDFTVWSPSGNFNLVVESEYRRIVGLLRGQDLTHENNVYAKMPGKIVKISAKMGDKVKKGDPVMVMEAMKMENEIRSVVDGTISNICVKEGQAVETGTLLAELDLTEASAE
jgi:biotin carboxyl carrier protein